MRQLLLAMIGVFATGSFVKADDVADAKAIVEKALKATGVKPDDKLSALTWKDKGVFDAMGAKMTYTADWAFQGPDKYRFVLDGEFAGQKLKITVVVNGEKAWESDGKTVEEIKGEKLEYTKNEVYQMWVGTLKPLVTEKGFTLATAKGKDVNGKPTNAVKVTAEKRPAITLYFDKETGFVVKTEIVVKDEFQKWKEVLDEAFYEEYKEIDGKKYFTKLRLVRDGKAMIQTTLSDQKMLEKLDAKLFEKP